MPKASSNLRSLLLGKQVFIYFKTKVYDAKNIMPNIHLSQNYKSKLVSIIDLYF